MGTSSIFAAPRPSLQLASLGSAPSSLASHAPPWLHTPLLGSRPPPWAHNPLPWARAPPGLTQCEQPAQREGINTPQPQRSES